MDASQSFLKALKTTTKTDAKSKKINKLIEERNKLEALFSETYKFFGQLHQAMDKPGSKATKFKNVLALMEKNNKNLERWRQQLITSSTYMLKVDNYKEVVANSKYSAKVADLQKELNDIKEENKANMDQLKKDFMTLIGGKLYPIPEQQAVETVARDSMYGDLYDVFDAYDDYQVGAGYGGIVHI